ncbi:MAG TPA: mercury resistance system transport protein MerF [Candidatus Binatia bacterium]|jgi:mercuric ion transport protein
MTLSFPGQISDPKPRADRCCKTGMWGSVITALCCLTPLLVFVLGGVGLTFLTPYLDYLLVPLFAVFLTVGIYGWMRGGQIIRRR